MSSIRFAGEDDNVGAGTRSRKSKRRTSSILKAQSPSRMALGDLDPNAAEQNKALDAKRKRRSSKRVSFADTFHVQEFWTAHHAKEFGLWDTNRDGTKGEKANKQKDADNSEKHVNEPRPEEQPDANVTCDKQEQGTSNISVGPGHRITGLETLLTGQIRNTAATDDNVCDGGPIQVAEPELPPAVAQLQLEIQNLSSNTASYPPVLQVSQPIQAACEIDRQQLDDLAFDLPFTQPDQIESTSSESSHEEVKVNKKHSRRSLTMVGASSYLCPMPSNESAMSVSVDPSMDHQQWSMHQQANMNQSQGAADMDLTGNQMSFSHHDASAHQNPDEQTDNQSFFQKFMVSSNAPAAASTHWMGENLENDVFGDENDSPDEKTDNRSFFQQLMSNTAPDAACNFTGVGTESPVPDKLDSKSFLASLMGGSSSQAKADPPPRFNKTQMFGQDETIAGMDLTTCIGGIQSNQESSSRRQPLGERIQALSSDMSVRFGGHDDEGEMEMTHCYGSNKTADVSVRMPKQSSSGKANATQIFDQSGALEFTTCIGGITGSNHTQFTTANMSGLTFMKDKTFSNVTMNNTSAVLRDIDSALGLKRKSDVPTEELQDAHTEKMRRGGEEQYESTRVFSGTFVPGKPDVRDQPPPVLSPIRKEAGDVDHGVCGEETAAIELTSCIRAKELKHAPSALESTRIFQADNTAGMELTACVGNETMQKKNSTESKLADDKGNRTRVFSADDSGEMEMTECHSVVVAGARSLNKTNQAVIAPADLERTKVFKPDETCGMEFTTCVGNLIVENTVNKGSAQNTSVRRVTQQSQRPGDMDRSKVYQPDDTCGMGFEDVLASSQSKGNKSSRKFEAEVKRHSEPSMNSTKIYQPNETCDLEFTTCLKGPIEVQNNTRSMVQGKGNTAKMETTGCAGQLGTSQIFKEQQNVNRTRLISEEMEMTECIDSYIPSSQQKSDASLNSSVQVPCGEVTKMFSDNTAKMEMTECIGGVLANTSQPLLLRNQSLATSISNAGQEERTRVFTEDVGGMEMTECIGGVLANTTLQALPKGKSLATSFNHPDQEERTRVFTEDVGGMEMTECIGGVLANTSHVSLPRDKSLATSFSHPDQEERTRVFTEDVGGMEMTECIGGVLANTSQSSLPRGKSLATSFSHPGQEDQTRVFSEDVGGMDMTECIGGVLANTTQGSTLQKGKSPYVPGKQHNQEDQTRVFSDDIGGMEMTECVGGLIPAESILDKSNQQKEMSPREHTKVFMSEDTAKMDMTECVGTLFPDFTYKSANESNQNISVAARSRLHSESETTAKINTTECDGGVFPSFASTTKTNLSMSRLKQIQADFDHTKVFSDDNAGMEMTECIGSAFPTFAHDTTANKTAVVSDKSECTRVFSEDTGKMEMTECVGAVFPSFASSAGLASAKKGDKSSCKDVLDQTKIFFGEDTCRMEMTECIGAVFPSCAPRPDAGGDDKENEHEQRVSLSHSRLAPSVKDLSTIVEEKSMRKSSSGLGKPDITTTDRTQMFSGNDGGMEMTENISIADVVSDETTRNFRGDMTKIFSEHTAKMEMTECIGGGVVIGSSERSVMQQGCQGEHTRVFSENTARMDMTECVSGVISTGTDTRNEVVNATTNEMGEDAGSKSEVANGDVTKVFSEHTARMEMTECIGGVLSGENVNTPLSISRLGDEQGQGENTKVFSDITAKMDMTECVGGVISTNVNEREGLSNKDANSTPNMSDQPKEGASGVTDEDKRRSDTFTFEDNVATEPKRSSDTFTVTETSVVSPQSGHHGEDVSKDEELRRSDTFTVDKSSLELESSKGANNDKALQEGNGDLSGPEAGDGERLSSVESYTGDGIMEEETLVMDNTEELADYSALLKKGFTEPDVTTMDMDCQLSMNVSVFEASGLMPVPYSSSLTSSQSTSSQSTSSSVSQSSHVSDALPRLSQGEKSMLGLSVLDINTTQSTLPTSGPVQIDEFLDFLSIASTLPKGRRSVMNPVSMAPAETLGDFLNLSLITQPKHQMYEWANEYLATSAEKMRESIKEQEECLSKENPAIVKELQHATPERSAELRKKVVALQESCKKSVKKTFKEWRKKMTTTNLESLNTYHEELESRISTVCSSTKKMEDSLAELEQYDAELDAAITQFGDTQLPTAEEQQKYCLEKEQLDRINQQVEQQKKTIASLEKQKSDLKADVEALQTIHQEMELEQENLVCQSQPLEFDKGEAVDRINRIHRMQEWRLEEYKDDGSIARISFLEGSLSLVFKLGNKVGGEECKIREVVDVSCESLLGDDACIAAKVANTMALKSLDVVSLKRQTTTTKNLPQVLQQLSSKICPARLMYDEVTNIAFWHQLTYSEFSLTVEFSSLEANLKFFVTFELTPGAYPMKHVHHSYKHKIGQNIEQELQDRLCSVKPGWNYLSRLTSTVEDLIQSKIPKQEKYL